MTSDKTNPDELLQGGTNAAIELSETDLDKVAGGDKSTTSINDISFGVSKDKQTSANKNAAAVKALL